VVGWEAERGGISKAHKHAPSTHQVLRLMYAISRIAEKMMQRSYTDNRTLRKLIIA
jgi:hypothetical protein